MTERARQLLRLRTRMRARFGETAPPRRAWRPGAAWIACAVAWMLLDIGAAGQRPLPQMHRGKIRDLAAGKFLVASRNLPDPSFTETVVLLAEFGEEGAMGLVLNRPSDLPVGRLLSGMKGAADRSDTVFVGGPVSPTGIVALVRSRTPVDGARRVFDDVHLITTRAPLEALIAAEAKPRVFRVYLGYSGWSPSQLEAEVALGAWHVFPADADVVFDPDPETAWPRQIRRTESLRARGSVVPHHRRGDDHALHLGRTLVDLAGPGVAEQSLDRRAAPVAR